MKIDLIYATKCKKVPDITRNCKEVQENAIKLKKMQRNAEIWKEVLERLYSLKIFQEISKKF